MTVQVAELHSTLAGTEWLPAPERQPGRVSVIIPSYNHARFICQAIRSVAVQTHGDIELIVIDDGSTDGSVGTILEAIEECGIDNAIVEARGNGGTGAAVNQGLIRSSGQYVTVLNSDDYYHPNRIAELLRAMDDADAEFAFSQVTHVDRDGRPASPSAFTGYQTWLNEVELHPTTGFCLLRWNGMVSSSNLLVSAALVERVGLFSDLQLASDWEYALRALAETEPVFVRQDLLFYRVHPGGTLVAGRYTDAERNAEFERVVSTYFALVDGPAPPNNKLAPGPHGWPDDFENFLRSDSVTQMWPSEYPEMSKLWTASSTSAVEPMMPPEELIELVGGGGKAGYRAVGAEFRIRAILAGLRPDHRVLDIGCGSGRIAAAFVDYLTDEGSYAGFDIVPAAIDWCREEISSRHQNFAFDLADVHSDLYRPDGAVSPLHYRFPYEDDSFDFVILTSVFTHLLPDAVDAYAREIARVLKPGGRCLATFFLGNEQSYGQLDRGLTAICFDSNGGVYRTVADGPVEWAVCHDEASVLAMLRLRGLRVAEAVQYGRWADPESAYSFQDIVILEAEPLPAPPESTGLQLVTVSHRPNVYEEHLGSSKASLRHPIVKYDNTVANDPLPVRYNTFIDTEMADGWVAFVHHDFCFDADPLPMLVGASPDHIYGIIGARLIHRGRYGFMGVPGRSSVLWERGRVRSARLLGRVKCQPVVQPDGVVGEAFDTPLLVDTVDCCCVIVHSSLIRRFGLRFDERFAWHFYSEDFSLSARTAHGIETYVLPIEAGHYGISTGEAAGFSETLGVLLEKHGSDFGSTCYVPDDVHRLGELRQLPGLVLRRSRWKDS